MEFGTVESGREKEGQAHELALKLDELVLGAEFEVLHRAINLMGGNTRERLSGAVCKPER